MTPVELTLAGLAFVVAVLSAAITAVVREVDAVRALSLADDGVRGADALLWLTERPLTTHRISAVIGILAAVIVGLAAPLPLGARNMCTHIGSRCGPAGMCVRAHHKHHTITPSSHGSECHM